MNDLEKKITKNATLSRYIEFSLGNEHYAIPLLNTKEVISIPNTTPIPNSPIHFVGIMNLRGQVISILDLRKKLNIKPNVNQAESAVIIVSLDDCELGLIVDSINRVINIEFASQVDKLPEVSGQVNSKYISGIYKNENNSLTALLDLSKILDIHDISPANKKIAS